MIRGGLFFLTSSFDAELYRQANHGANLKSWRAYYHFARIGASQHYPGIRVTKSFKYQDLFLIKKILGPGLHRQLLPLNYTSLANFVNEGKPQIMDLEKPHDITVVVPVYGGLNSVETCLRSIKKSFNLTKYQVLVIDDCTPDASEKAQIQSIAKSLGFNYQENSENLGFVKTCNTAFEQTTGDVLLLNSDTEVYDHWIDSFISVLSETTGTISTLSNNATIYSIPLKATLEKKEVNEKCRDFSKILWQYGKEPWEIPTAHGFCMYVTRNCLNKLKGFNEELFGQGYGEENEFSFRVKQAGFKNIINPRTVVFHEGSVSFGHTVTERQKAARDNLLSVWPKYEKVVAKYLATNPLPEFINRVRLWSVLSGRSNFDAHFSHSLGGGTDTAIRNEINENEFRSLVVRPHNYEGTLSLELFDEFGSMKYPKVFGHGLTEISETLKNSKIRNILIHHQIGFQLLEKIIEEIGKPYIFRIHDYHSICPFVNLADRSGVYCGENGAASCNLCISTRHPSYIDIDTYRLSRANLLFDAESITCPSLDTAQRIQKYYRHLNVTYEPNVDHPKLAAKIITEQVTNAIVVIGELTINKGLNFVVSIAESGQYNGSIHLIGQIPNSLVTHEIEKLKNANRLIEHGKFSGDDHAIELILKINPSLIFFPGKIPETFSYTTGIALNFDLPILACNIGAIPERLRNASADLHLFDVRDSAESVAELITEITTGKNR